MYLDCVNKIQNVKIIHLAALISLIFTGKKLASGNSDWLVALESYQPNWLVIKKVNFEPWFQLVIIPNISQIHFTPDLSFKLTNPYLG